MKNKFPRGIEVVGSAIIENGIDQILLTKSSKLSNKWTMPGGHIEIGEKISDAMAREVKEETGLTVKYIDIIAWGELIDSKDFHRPAHFIYFDVYFKIANNSDILLDQSELQEFVWVSPNEALRMDLADSYEDTINKFIKYIK